MQTIIFQQTQYKVNRINPKVYIFLINSFHHSVYIKSTKYLLSIYYVPGTVLCTEDKAGTRELHNSLVGGDKP